MPRVVIKHLTKVFPGTNGTSTLALTNLDLVVEERELLVLVGPSGCGKTTTLRLIAGLETPSSGTISIDNRVVNALPPKERDVAMVFQSSALYPHLSVYENLAFGLMVRRVPKPQIRERVGRTARMLGLSDCLDRLPSKLSLGQRQRVALGRAIVRQPRVFLFDEPLSNLDTHLRTALRQEIVRLHEEAGAASIYVTHDQFEAMTLGTRVAVLAAGVLQQVAPPVELYQNPANMFVAGFLGAPPMNFFKGSLVMKSGLLFFRGGGTAGHSSDGPIEVETTQRAAATLSSQTDRPVIMGLRPEHISVRSNPAISSESQMVNSVLKRVETTGPDILVHLTAGEASFIARVPTPEGPHNPGQVVAIFRMDHAHFFDPETGRNLCGS